MKKKKEENPTYETLKKLRGDWGNVDPVTKVIPDKRRKPPKHKGRENEES